MIHILKQAQHVAQEQIIDAKTQICREFTGPFAESVPF